MARLVALTNDNDLQRFCALPGTGAVTAETLARQRPDASWLESDGHSSPVARCSLWWSETPQRGGERVGLIGHFGLASGHSAQAMLDHACSQLAGRGCTLAVGPLDGNTWNRYRLLSERGGEPLFFLEPDNPDEWPQEWRNAGFASLAEYYSAVNADLTRDAALADSPESITIRALAPERWDEELRGLFTVALPSFAANFLYSPVSETDFVALYRPLQGLVRPELVLIAEDGGRPIGFAFAIPDLLQAKRGVTVDTVILKSLAVMPEYAGRGVGRKLMARCHRTAQALGFRRVIHALMHEENRSKRMSEHTAQIIRRYTLFARRLNHV